MRILFVCRANLCRSPMAESIMQHTIRQADVNGIEIASAGTHVMQTGFPPVPEVQQMLDQRGYACSARSRQLDYVDFNHYDYIFAMDRANLRFIQRHNRGTHARAHLLLGFTGLQNERNGGEVLDPYPDGDFGATFDLLSHACDRLVAQIVLHN